jgi:hypothetical protein
MIMRTVIRLLKEQLGVAWRPALYFGGRSLPEMVAFPSTISLLREQKETTGS